MRRQIESRNACASVVSSTGVWPNVTMRQGPRTEPAGLTGTTCPVTKWSNR